MTTLKIKFTKDNSEFINELRAKVKEYFELNKLSKYGNTNLVIKSIFMFSLYLVPYFLMVFGVINAIWLIIMLWMIMGVGMSGIGMVVMHDANHGSFSKHSRINKLLGRSMYLLGGFPANWRYQHNTMHHGYTNIDGHDEDIDPASILRFSPHKPLKKIHRYQHWYAIFLYGLMTFTWIIDKDIEQLLGYKKRGISLSSKRNYNGLMFDLVISKLFYYVTFLIIPLIFIPVSWYWVLLGFFTMHYVSGLILTTIFQTAHVMPSSEYPLPDESGNIENNWAIHQLQTTADYSPKSRLFSWMIGGLNYQIEHHLFPNICHIHYKKISKLVKETAQKYNLPYHVHNNFFVALIHHFKMLKALGR